MKSFKRIAAMLLTFVLMFMIVPADKVKAATDEFPNKFRVYEWGGNEHTEEIQMPDHHTYIKNVKSKNANLIAGLTDYKYSSSGNNKDTYTLSFMAKKQGTFDVTYDVMKDSKKVKTVKAKVYVYPKPISVKLDGEQYYYGNKTTAKLKVTALKGNAIQKIEVGTYEKEEDEFIGGVSAFSEIKYQAVKNNSKINLGTTGYYYKYITDDYGNERTYNDVQFDQMSLTRIRVTYKDQYTKCSEHVEFSFRGIAK